MNSTVVNPFDYGPALFNDRLGFAHRKLRRIDNYKELLIVSRIHIRIALGIVYFLSVVLSYFAIHIGR